MADNSRREDENSRSPGLEHQMFLTMNDLLDKLQLLDYEQVLVKHNLKPLSRLYFAASPYIPSNPGEQFYTFSVIAAWLINLCGRSFETPQKHDDPNTIISNILMHLRALGGLVEFPPAKLKSGSGEHVCYVLDYLADEALKCKPFVWKRSLYPSEDLEEEYELEDDDELTLNEVEDLTEEDAEYEDIIDLRSRTHHSEVSRPRPEMILESVTDSAEWYLEVERVLPQLKVSVHKDVKDFKSQVNQLHRHQDGITRSLKEAKGYVNKLLGEISKTQEKVSSREKYINTQLEHLITDYRDAHSKFSEVKKLYQQASEGVTKKTRTLAEINEKLKKVKQEINEKGSRMSDGAPVVRIRQSLSKLKQEIRQMDVRIGVVEHTLLQGRLQEKSKMTRDMHATPITESTTHTYS